MASRSKAKIPMGKNIGTQGDDPKGDALETHNRLRAKHNAPALSLDSKLTNHAQEYADQLLGQGKEVKAAHSKWAKNFGEGLQILSKYKYPISTVLDSWYTAESAKFNWKVKNYTDGCGHLTQMIWKETAKLGVGYATDHNPDRTIIVLLYDPTGNVFHTFGKNIEAAKK
ncbi:unnamed protein product [Allacma fusca]|uniref:SCP domain-containing protein n=1 Tax=Allacma fusca TaxID=39272 RepID=A0A8J2NN57_9HEXA|nr:unnamed protein product [Allacma fusca]